jgi:microcystin-dependent protein
MAKLLKLRRGTTTQHGSFTGAEGEVTVDTDKETLVVHDGSTAGGHPVAAEDMANVSSASIAGRLANDSLATSKLAAGALPSDVTVSGSNITAGAIHDSDVNASAAIVGTKISPDFGSQNIATTGTITSNDITISDTNPKINFTDSDHNPDYAVQANSGTFAITDATASTDRIRINSDGHIDLKTNVDCEAGIDVTGNVTVTGTVDGVDVAALSTNHSALNTAVSGLSSGSGALTNGVTATTQSASDNSTKVATTAYTDTAISNLVDSSPGALNTLNELAAAINDDASFSTTVTNNIATKMPLAGGEFTGDVTTHNITPDGDSTRNLGTNSVRFANIYGDTLYGDGSNLTGIVSFVTGMIILWSGAANAIPSGWVLCDGNNSTPNLSGKFVVGYSASDGDYDVDDTGGSATVTLTTAQLPAHNHTTSDHSHSFSGSGSSSHTHTVGGTLNSGNRGMGYFGNMANGLGNTTTSSATVNLTVSGTTGNAAPTTANTGSGNAHENRPPFYALCYIMKS